MKPTPAQREVDITPSPSVLAVLGEIPFGPWQCLAELIDNSVDAMRKAKQDADDVAGSKTERRVLVSWSGDEVARDNRTVEVIDTGPGMTLDAVRNCVRAGYSTNDPMGNLGLFGMGFNIATARLGEKTVILSTRRGDTEWTGIEIDFQKLKQNDTFKALVISAPKEDLNVQGTRVVVSRLKPEMTAELLQKSTSIHQTLEEIYTTILAESDIEILVQNAKLNPRPHCVWSPDRYVIWKNRRVQAIQRIDASLGVSLFDTDRFRYLTPVEQAEAEAQREKTGALPKGIVARDRRIAGWIGIQRYADPNDFGVDFIRNGRKILKQDKTLFSYYNEQSNSTTLEYPIELGATVGGRIVGEIHVDHLHPNYQKNDFTRYGLQWREVVEFLRGQGPLLPKMRKAMGFSGDNESPLGLLANAYRRADAGTRNLAARNPDARRMAVSFRKGMREYQDDAKWWDAARAADRENAESNASRTATPDPGQQISDDLEEFSPVGGSTVTEPIGAAPAPARPEGGVVAAAPPAPKSHEAFIADLKNRSRENPLLSREYRIRNNNSPMRVTAWEITNGEISRGAGSISTQFYRDGVDCHYFFNPRHSLFQQFAISPKQILLTYLADKFKSRDNLIEDAGEVFIDLFERYCDEAKVEVTVIQESARAYFDALREAAVELLAGRAREVMECVHESPAEVQDIGMNLALRRSDLVERFSRKDPATLESLFEAPPRTLIRLVGNFPEAFFDEKFFSFRYATLSFADAAVNQRIRDETLERVVSFLRDAQWILQEQSHPSSDHNGRKEEIQRCAHSLSLLRRNTTRR